MNKPSATPSSCNGSQKNEASRAVICTVLLALATGSNGGCFIGKKINDESKPRAELSEIKGIKTDSLPDSENINNRIRIYYTLTNKGMKTAKEKVKELEVFLETIGSLIQSKLTFRNG